MAKAATKTTAKKGGWKSKAKSEDYVSATDRLLNSYLEAINNNVAPWQCISVRRGDVFKPANLLYNTPYRGFNRLTTGASLEANQNLSVEKYDIAKALYGEEVAAALRSKFITFKKATEDFGFSMKGIQSNSSIYQPGSIYYTQPDGKKWVRKDDNGNFMLPSKEEVDRFNLTAHRFAGSVMPVWSALNFVEEIPPQFIERLKKQIENLNLPPLPENASDYQTLSNDLCEALGIKIVDTDIDFASGERTGGYYSVSNDSIHMRPFFMHENPDRYFKTVAHECGHATGSASRLNRETLLEYAKEDNSPKEELVAEITSSFVCSYFGIPTEGFYHQAYVKGYANLLTDSKKELLNAAREAEKASEYIIQAYEVFYEKKYGVSIKQNLDDVELDMGMDEEKISEAELDQRALVLDMEHSLPPTPEKNKEASYEMDM